MPGEKVGYGGWHQFAFGYHPVTAAGDGESPSSRLMDFFFFFVFIFFGFDRL